MDKAEVKQIADFFMEVGEDLCEGEAEAALRLDLTELYRIIRRLMDATSATEDQGLKVLLATMEKRAREYTPRTHRHCVRRQSSSTHVAPS